MSTYSDVQPLCINSKRVLRDKEIIIFDPIPQTGLVQYFDVHCTLTVGNRELLRVIREISIQGEGDGTACAVVNHL